jgi:hypothetical protein
LTHRQDLESDHKPRRPATTKHQLTAPKPHNAAALLPAHVERARSLVGCGLWIPCALEGVLSGVGSSEVWCDLRVCVVDMSMSEAEVSAALGLWDGLISCRRAGVAARQPVLDALLGRRLR